MLSADDYMDRALFHAARGRGRTSPNPMVGAVVVRPDGVIVGQGSTEPAGGPHAEIEALDEAGPQARGATLYCTLEPCSHVGRTGPCVVRIAEAGIARVVASLPDPNPLVNGKGFAFLRDRGITVEVGPGASKALHLNQPFFTWIREGRPFVILKAALSLDGAIAEVPGFRTQLTSAPANRHAQRVRAEVDAIGVGAGTVLADDPLLTVRDAYRERPLIRVIFDRRLRTPPTARLLSTHEAGPVIIVTSAAAAMRADLRGPLEAQGAQIEVTDDGSLRAGLMRLGSRQINSLLLEGGAAIHQAALAEDVVDFVRLYVTPRALGSGAVPFAQGRPFSSASLAFRRIEPLGPDVMIEGYVHGPH
jgi:diaminohydroxyphosphoribosylaminopyrimidine deaminase/5-amino-6-(5-phosphoribosylamino)uracil reductase